MPNILLIENTYPDPASLSRVLNYIFRSNIIGGYALDPQNASHQMMLVKRAFHKEDGVQLKHFVVSFSTAEMYRYDTDDLLHLGFEIGQLFQEYQLAYAIHYDSVVFPSNALAPMAETGYPATVLKSSTLSAPL